MPSAIQQLHMLKPNPLEPVHKVLACGAHAIGVGRIRAHTRQPQDRFQTLEDRIMLPLEVI
jgi:hypothetical protein